MSRCLFLVFLALYAIPSAAAPTATDRRQQFLSAVALQDADPMAYDAARQALDGYVLAPYLDYARLKGHLATLDAAAARHFLDAEAGTQLGDQFRREYLKELARRGDWPTFLDFADGSVSAGVELSCLRLRALSATGRDGEARGLLASLWATGDSLPRTCDPPLATARDKGWVSADLVWQRLRLAVDAPNSNLAKYLASLLPAAQRRDGERLAAAVGDPDGTLKAAGAWPDQPLNREAVAVALKRSARRDIDRAMGYWQGLEGRFAFGADERAAILRDLALYAAVAYRPAAESWFEQVPVAARDQRLVEWQLRAALAVQDWGAVLHVTEGLPAGPADEPRNRYWRARALESLGRGVDARSLYAGLATEANYHGFLAADRLDRPYTICPRAIEPDPAREAVLRGEINVARALELHAIGWRTEAVRAWDFARVRAGDADRLPLILLASEAGWDDRVILALNRGDDLQHYRLRFPIDRRDTVEQASKANGLDPVWTLALIRAESAWQTDARSPVNALGLMQLMPATGQRMARELGIAWQGSGMLLDPVTNIRLGTRYLAQQAERFGGSPWLATAAYNAGPTPVQRWLSERGTLPPDVFIETIPYGETRDYVMRVLAFGVIYDWRLDGMARRMSSRMLLPNQQPADAVARQKRRVTCAGGPEGLKPGPS
ncbi:MAG: lytic murein transglycosylase [Gammaproteobacteria bacterium PRO9]|nr:lytic murein transglycosylase [Gammaproteobacteria bacterium PRO9]